MDKGKRFLIRKKYKTDINRIQVRNLERGN